MSSMTITRPMPAVRRAPAAPTKIGPTRVGPTRVGPTRVDSGQVRLTRRGRLVVFGLALMVMLVLGVVWGSGSVATLHPGTPVPTRIVVVEPGDTLYGIAQGVTTDGQVGETVEKLMSMNGLDDPMLQVGQHLRVPVAH